MKKLLLVILTISFVSCAKVKNDEKPTIITTNFVTYDFTRSIVGDKFNVEMLLKPGQEAHSYDPSVNDIKNIINSKLFIYMSNKQEMWVDSILNSLSDVETLNIIEHFNLEDEEHNDINDEHEDHDHQDDEHIWTSIDNSIEMLEIIKDKVTTLDPNNSNLYTSNCSDYISKLKLKDEKFKQVIKENKIETLVFADRFPFKYFINEYGLEYKAAYNGCSFDVEASSTDVKNLIDYIKENNVKYVFVIEFSNRLVANTVSQETKAQILEFHSGHNISLDDFNANISYLDILDRNIESLEKVIND